MEDPFTRFMLLAGLALTVAGPAAASAACVAKSGERRAVLLELYTSEGCDSCPPADRRLSRLKDRADLAGRVVPLAFHVDYWDRLGWTDRFASPDYSRRQYDMAGRALSRAVYTPQFLRNGRDWRGPGDPVDAAVEAPATTTISLEFDSAAGAPLAVEARFAALKPGAEAWLAVYENNLESRVLAGENGGKVLRHDYVVRRLLGPLSPDADGRLSLSRRIVPAPDWKRTDLGVAAFVQDRASGEILQALQRHACPG